MSQLISEITAHLLKKNIPEFRSGDTIRLSVKIVEGDKERVQDYEGVVIARKHTGVNETVMVRRVSFGVGMERIFQIHSPRIEEIKVVRRGKVRRAKLYYLRALSGKKARLTERKTTNEPKAAPAAAVAKA